MKNCRQLFEFLVKYYYDFLIKIHVSNFILNELLIVYHDQIVYYLNVKKNNGCNLRELNKG